MGKKCNIIHRLNTRGASNLNNQKPPPPPQEPAYESDDSLTLDQPVALPPTPVASSSDEENGQKSVRDVVQINVQQRYKFPSDARHRYEAHDPYFVEGLSTVSSLTPANEIRDEIALIPFKSRAAQAEIEWRERKKAATYASDTGRSLSPPRDYREWKRHPKGYTQHDEEYDKFEPSFDFVHPPRLRPVISFRGGVGGRRGTGANLRDVNNRQEAEAARSTKSLSSSSAAVTRSIANTSPADSGYSAPSNGRPRSVDEEAELCARFKQQTRQKIEQATPDVEYNDDEFDDASSLSSNLFDAPKLTIGDF